MSELKNGMNVCIESRALPDGKGGLFLNDELIQDFDTEAESDSAAIHAVRMMIVDGIAEQAGQAFKDDKPIELFDMNIW